MLGTREFRRIQATCWNADVRLRDMDMTGCHPSGVSDPGVFLSYAHAGDEATRIARIFNDLALEICAPQPDRLWPFCQVPLQDTDAACAEVERCLC
jgi:aminocarboxymuconate-semialdehyde decarboxylase